MNIGARSIGAVSLGCMLVGTLHAFADESAQAVSEPSRSGASGERNGAYVHDGFYLRGGIGAGIMLGEAKSELGESKLGGLGFPTQFAVGGTLTHGLVAAGSFYGLASPKPRYGSQTDDGPLTNSGIGPLVDFYFDPKAGAHLQAALLYTWMRSSSHGNEVEGAGSGFAVSIGAGYETWVHKQLSLGLLFQLVYDDVKMRFTSQAGSSTNWSPCNAKECQIRMVTPGLLFTLTYQ